MKHLKRLSITSVHAVFINYTFMNCLLNLQQLSTCFIAPLANKISMKSISNDRQMFIIDV